MFANNYNYLNMYKHNTLNHLSVILRKLKIGIYLLVVCHWKYSLHILAHLFLPTHNAPLKKPKELKFPPRSRKHFLIFASNSFYWRFLVFIYSPFFTIFGINWN